MAQNGNKTAYQKLEDHFARIMKLHRVLEILQWDQATTMPPGAAETRAEEMAELQVLIHDTSMEPRVLDWLEEAKNEDLDLWQKANLREMRRLYVHATALPSDLVASFSRACAACEMFWREARKKNDFNGLVPYLTRVVDLVREKGEATAKALGITPYEALLDYFEPGGSVENINMVFGDLEKFIPGLVDEILEHQAKQPEPIPPSGIFPIEKQRALSLKVMEVLGFEFQNGRLDLSSHPFCGGTPEDVRITTRYSEDALFSGLMSTIHETGHALYERGLPSLWKFQPVGKARGMSIHESQSLLMERQVCESKEFFRFLAPLVRETFGGQGPAWESDNLYRFCTKVKRSFIRVEADPVTYPAHVILRFQLEKAFMSRDLKVADLPGAWNDGMKRLLGIEPPNNKNGCMQDIHWMSGLFGYFPTYTLGAMTAAQLFEAAVKADPSIPQSISEGKIRPLREWLRTNVHSLGSLLSTEEMLIKATGKPLDAEVFRRALRRQYLGV